MSILHLLQQRIQELETKIEAIHQSNNTDNHFTWLRTEALGRQLLDTKATYWKSFSRLS